ncbi:MAG: hypothetical protein V2I33_24720 [Kangiellaceae bacterium]|jgi:hypothetical protein|nr:hypothetical protein [Kangiellaceae bacterium]
MNDEDPLRRSGDCEMRRSKLPITFSELRIEESRFLLRDLLRDRVEDREPFFDRDFLGFRTIYLASV